MQIGHFLCTTIFCGAGIRGPFMSTPLSMLSSSLWSQSVAVLQKNAIRYRHHLSFLFTTEHFRMSLLSYPYSTNLPFPPLTSQSCNATYSNKRCVAVMNEQIPIQTALTPAAGHMDKDMFDGSPQNILCIFQGACHSSNPNHTIIHQQFPPHLTSTAVSPTLRRF